jgi:hypothetical protein
MNALNTNPPPCPYCGAPLASPRAKQCLKCHFDWHDPANVGQLADPNWNRFGLDLNKEYVVELCQERNGRRFTKYREVLEGIRDEFAVLETTVARGSQFIRWGFYSYSDHLKLSDGQSFGFEAHGIWLTKAESDFIWHQDRNPGTTPWVNGIPPNFPPK